MRTVVISHGDCDGVIAASLYVRHFLMDVYPSRLSVGFTQPWRASREILRMCREDCERLVLLDIAVDKEVFSAIVDIVMRGVVVTVIDHHTTTFPWIEKMRSLGVNIMWGRSSSTPRLMFEKLGLTPNPYEEMLIDVADACEGSETRDPERKRLGDLVKLAMSRDPSDISFIHTLFESFLKGRDIEEISELRQRARVSRMLLDKLTEKIAREGEVIKDYVLLCLHPAESRIYAGLFGIASTEAGKKIGRDVILIRDEDTKIVVTIRSFRGRALDICKEVTTRITGAKYGGHSEAASITVSGKSLREVATLVREVLWIIG